ncbi:hypothetical protein EIP86_006680 [Pleurotus ostreatoroseus]|nr:hypothetical protein EIP86_006680 [Pleurotus ostreatoroseus]
MKPKPRPGDALPSATSIAAAAPDAALPCTLGSSAFARPPPHLLSQLRLRPASWSDDSDGDDDELALSDDDDRWRTGGAREAQPSAAQSAPSPSAPPKRPAGSITGIFGREVHLWAASSMYPQPVHPYAAGPSVPAPPKAAPKADAPAGPAEHDIDEQMSESDVAEWDSAPGSSSVHSVPPSEDEESSGEPMAIDEAAPPEAVSEGPETVSNAPVPRVHIEPHPVSPQPLRQSRRARSGSKHDAPAEIPSPVVTTPVHALAQEEEESEEEVTEAQEVVELLTPHDEQMRVDPSTPPGARDTTSQASPMKQDTIPTQEQPQPTNPAQAPANGGARPPVLAIPEEEEEEEVPIVRREDQAPPIVYVSPSGDKTSQEVPAVMMFGRRSSPARAVPLNHFTRGPKGKIPCTWTAPPGHRPCTRSFTRRADLDRHIATVHQMLNVSCPKCGATFSRQDALTRHQRDSCAALFTHSH